MAKETKKEEEKKEEMVTIPKKELDNILGRIAKVEQDRDVLLQVADKRALGIYYQRHAGKIPTRVMLRVIQGTPKTKEPKVILGWRKLIDEVYQDPATLRWVERQTIELLYEDGTSEEMFYREFNRLYRQVPAEVKQKITNEETGELALRVVRLDTGQEYTIGINFIN